jgi:hypothetical protein
MNPRFSCRTRRQVVFVIQSLWHLPLHETKRLSLIWDRADAQRLLYNSLVDLESSSSVTLPLAKRLRHFFTAERESLVAKPTLQFGCDSLFGEVIETQESNTRRQLHSIRGFSSTMFQHTPSPGRIGIFSKGFSYRDRIQWPPQSPNSRFAQYYTPKRDIT